MRVAYTLTFSPDPPLRARYAFTSRFVCAPASAIAIVPLTGGRHTFPLSLNSGHTCSLATALFALPTLHSLEPLPCAADTRYLSAQRSHCRTARRLLRSIPDPSHAPSNYLGSRTTYCWCSF